MTDCRKQLTFSFHPSKAVVADFQGGLITSDAGDAGAGDFLVIEVGGDLL